MKQILVAINLFNFRRIKYLSLNILKSLDLHKS